MKAYFVTDLDIRRLPERRRRLLAALIFWTEVLKRYIEIGAGFEYDGPSIPWFTPMAYTALHDAAERAAAAHDYLYAHPEICSRAEADAVFRELLEIDGVGWFRRNYAWAGVRLGGWMHYGKSKSAAPIPDADPYESMKGE